MKQKSLRQLARELGVSHSYLSQVKHGKRPASAKVVSKMASNTKPYSSALCYNLFANAELCSGSTGDFGSLSPGSNPGSAAT
jgi:transcriptional regulator with XRE-family HTH domain